MNAGYQRKSRDARSIQMSDDISCCDADFLKVDQGTLYEFMSIYISFQLLTLKACWPLLIRPLLI